MILGDYVFVFIKCKTSWHTIAMYGIPYPKDVSNAKIIAIDLDSTDRTPTVLDWSNFLIPVNNGSNYLIIGAYIKQ